MLVNKKMLTVFKKYFFIVLFFEEIFENEWFF